MPASGFGASRESTCQGSIILSTEIRKGEPTCKKIVVNCRTGVQAAVVVGQRRTRLVKCVPNLGGRDEPPSETHKGHLVQDSPLDCGATRPDCEMCLLGINFSWRSTFCLLSRSCWCY